MEKKKTKKRMVLSLSNLISDVNLGEKETERERILGRYTCGSYADSSESPDPVTFHLISSQLALPSDVPDSGMSFTPSMFACIAQNC